MERRLSATSAPSSTARTRASVVVHASPRFGSNCCSSASAAWSPSGLTYLSEPATGGVPSKAVCSVRNQPISTSGLGPNWSRRNSFRISASPKRSEVLLCSPRSSTDRLESVRRYGVKDVRWTKDQRAAALGAQRGPLEVTQQRAPDGRVVEAVGQHVRLGRTVRVAHLDQRQRRVVRPARAVDDARGGDRPVLAAEPARLAQRLSRMHVRNAGCAPL